MTGESLPVDKTVGDEVSSGTVNQFGTFEMKATKVGEDSSIQRMIRLVQSADAGKAKIVGLADRFATWIVVIALSCCCSYLAVYRSDHPSRYYSGCISAPALWSWPLLLPLWRPLEMPQSTDFWSVKGMLWKNWQKYS